MAENEHIDYEGSQWPPPDVLDDDAGYQQEDLLKYHSRTHTHQPRRQDFTSPAAAAEPLHQLHSRSTPRPQRTSYPTSGAFGGPGMQAVFLDSAQRSCGTGVFLPRMAGNDSLSSYKPARPPVLLPFRVVQALNLNVRELVKQPRRVYSKQTKRIGCNSHKNTKSINNDGSGQYCSPEIFLPKEWTY